MSYIGRQNAIGIAVETSRGTAVSSPAKWFKNVENSIQVKVDKVSDEKVNARLEEASDTRVVRQWYEGSIEGVLHIDALGYLLKNLYGSPTTSTVVTSTVYQHIYNLSQTIEKPTLTLFLKEESVDQKKIAGGVVSKLELTATTDDYVRFTADMMGRTESANSSSPTFVTEYDFIGKDISVKMATTEAGLSSATALGVKNLSLSFDSSAISDFLFGSKSPDDIYNTVMKIEGSLTLNYEDTTFKDLYSSNGARYMQIVIQGDQDLGSGNNPTITVLLYKAQVTDWNRTGGADDLAEQEVTIKGLFNSTDSKQSQITIQNATATY